MKRVIVFTCILSFLFFSLSAQGFNNFQWGTEKSKVKLLVNNKLEYENNTTLNYSIEDGSGVFYEYIFDFDNKLIMGVLNCEFTIKEYAFEDSAEFIKDVLDKYIRQFGKPTKYYEDDVSIIAFWDFKDNLYYVEKRNVGGYYVNIVHASIKAKDILYKRFITSEIE